MKRLVAATLLLIGLLVPLAVLAQSPAMRVIIVDPTGTHAASVSSGNLGTAGTSSVTVDTISHITSALHVAGIAQTVAVNCVTGCSASAGTTSSVHVSVALHVAGTIDGARFHIQGVGLPGQAHGGVLTIQGVTGGIPVPISGSITAGDSVNVFHQSTIRHISSLTHVVIVDWQRWAHLGVAQSGPWSVQAAHQAGIWTIAHISAMLHVSVVDLPRWAHLAVAQSGSWTVQAAHQAGQWNTAHVTSVTHVVGNMVLRNMAGTAVTVTGTALDVNCTGCSAAAATAVTHISAAVHVAGTINGAAFHVQGLGIPGQAHGGVLTIQGVTGGIPVPISGSISAGDAVNVFHQSTIRHISSVTHIQSVGRLGVDAHQGGSWTVAATQSGAYNVSAAQSGAFTVQAAHQGGEWNVRHIGSVTHIGGTGNAGALHISGISNIGSGAPGGTTTPMVCHTTVAFSTTADLLIAHSQNTWKIYICSVVLVAASAESVSIVEGTGATCQTSLRGLIGGFGGTMSLAANGGFSSVSPFPWLASSVAGNAVCLDKSGSGNVSGVMTYRAAP